MISEVTGANPAAAAVLPSLDGSTLKLLDEVPVKASKANEK